MATSYDCVVIGSGPGGYVAAIRAAQLGMTVAVIEKDLLGGRCLNVACIPAKAVLRAADIVSEIRQAGDFGIRVAEPSVDFPAVQDRRRKVVSTLTSGVSGLLEKHAIDLIDGRGSLTPQGNVGVHKGSDTVEIEVHTALILATGSVPKPIPGIELGGRVIGTEQAWALRELPATMAVVGAGASGAEIASAYARLGTQVALFEGLERVLPTEDRDVSKIAERSFRQQGIEVHTSTFVEHVQEEDEMVAFTCGDQRRAAEWLVIAAGRGPDAEGLGLAEAGVELTDHGLIAVDTSLRTSVAGVWAIGDLVRGPALAHKASEEGIIAVEDAANGDPRPIGYSDIPRATFCTPNVGSFGLTEEEARAAGHDVVVGKVQYGAIGAGAVYGDRQGLVKVVADSRYGELLGGHIVGAKATDLIQELVTAKALEGGYPELARITHGHPTLSEAVLEVARSIDGWLIHG
jgi:dihydrolipoamide dehydrogenase